jgi:hypothetical protein
MHWLFILRIKDSMAASKKRGGVHHPPTFSMLGFMRPKSLALR